VAEVTSHATGWQERDAPRLRATGLGVGL